MADNKTEQNNTDKGTSTSASRKADAGSKLGGMLKSIKLPSGGGRRTAGKDDEATLNENLHRLTRTELLEMLIDETKEADALRAENERLKEELTRCKADLDKTASLEVIIHRLEQIVNGR